MLVEAEAYFEFSCVSHPVLLVGVVFAFQSEGKDDAPNLRKFFLPVLTAVLAAICLYEAVFRKPEGCQV